jgi:hypothetical protein
MQDEDKATAESPRAPRDAENKEREVSSLIPFSALSASRRLHFKFPRV